MYFIDDIPVRREVRQRFVDEYDEAAREAALMRLVQHLAFGAPSRMTDRITVPYELLAMIEGKAKEAHHKKYCGQRILDRYLQHFPDATFNDHDYRAGLAREVVSSGLPDYLQPGNPKHEDCVFFASGRDATTSAIQRQRRATKARLRAAAADTYDVTQQLLDQFARHRDTLYAHPMSRIQHAYAVAHALPSATKRDRSTAALARIELQPVQLLFAPPLSARAYDTSLSYQQLTKAVLQSLYQGYYELDLKSAQLATVAALWNITVIQEFLSDDQCIWTELARAYNHPLTPPFKGALKQALYATIFGARRKTTDTILRDANTAPDPFNKHFIIRALHEARQRHVDGLSRNGTLTIGNRSFNTNNHRIPSLLAIQAQYEEQKLLEPIFGLARNGEGRRQSMSILVYKFDGLIVQPREGVNQHTTIKKAQEQVAKTAAKRGIHTRLEATQILE